MRPTRAARRCPLIEERLTADDDLRGEPPLQRHRAGREGPVRAPWQSGIGEAHQRPPDGQAAGLRIRRHAAGRGAERDSGPERLSDEWPAAARQRSTGTPAAPPSGGRSVPPLTAALVSPTKRTPRHTRGFFL